VFEDQKKEVKAKIVAVEKEHLLRREFELQAFQVHREPSARAEFTVSGGSSDSKAANCN
jgi:hypothetical protein